MLYARIRLRQRSGIVTASTATFALLVVQILAGMVTVLTGLNPFITALHLGLATAVFGAALVTAMLAYSSAR